MPSLPRNSRTPGAAGRIACRFAVGAVGIIALLAASPVRGLPMEQSSWIVTFGANVTVTAFSGVQSLYQGAGLQSTESKTEMLEIGDLKLMIAPAGDDKLKQQLTDAKGVELVEPQEEFESLEPLPEDQTGFAEGGTDISEEFGGEDVDEDFEEVPADDSNGKKGKRVKRKSRGVNPALLLNRKGPAAQTGGRGVTAFVIDTGVDVNHPAFRSGKGGKSRAISIDLTGEGKNDIRGHGTHVAGTIAGQKFGIARGVKIVGLKVFGKNRKSTSSNILRALQEVSKRSGKGGRAVVNMSLSGPRKRKDQKFVSATQRAIQALTRRNIAVVVSAGNTKGPACDRSPAFIPEAITVAAADRNRLAKFSSFGKCVDVIAPGVKVISAATGGGTKILSGTSMSSPVIAGSMAVLMSQGLTNKQAERRLLQVAVARVQDPKGSPNRALTPGLIPRLFEGVRRQDIEGVASDAANSTTGQGAANAAKSSNAARRSVITCASIVLNVALAGAIALAGHVLLG